MTMALGRCGKLSSMPIPPRSPPTIDFQIGTGGPQAIFPLSALPKITNCVTIDGTSQPGYTGYPLIEIDGVFAGFGVDGLTISAGSSTVQGLDIVRFSGNGIDLNSKGDDVIDSSIIGTDYIGTAGLGNAGSGVMIDNVPGNVIGTSLATGNVLSGNIGDGLTIFGSGATGNLVEGNYIGTDADDTQSFGLGNLDNGVEISLSDCNTIGGTTPGARNLISVNANGVLITNSDDNVVQGNHIGTNAAGTQAIGDDIGHNVKGQSEVGAVRSARPRSTPRLAEVKERRRLNPR